MSAPRFPTPKDSHPVRVYVSLAQEEYREWCRLASKEGPSLSAFVRNRVRATIPKEEV